MTKSVKMTPQDLPKWKQLGYRLAYRFRRFKFRLCSLWILLTYKNFATVGVSKPRKVKREDGQVIREAQVHNYNSMRHTMVITTPYTPAGIHKAKRALDEMQRKLKGGKG